jgi:hypothetical protein
VKPKFEPPKIDRDFFQLPEVAKADARWAATFGHGFESMADSDFVEWRDKVVLTNGPETKTVDGWVPVLRVIDGVPSDQFTLAKFYGDTEERRKFGVDDVVFHVLRHASWARPLAAAAEGRVRNWLLETIDGMKWEEWNLSANDRHHVAERREEIRSLFTHGAHQGDGQWALGRLDSIADLLLEPQAEANVHGTIPTRLKSMFEPLEAAAAASLGPGPHFKLDGVGAVGVLEDNNAIFANLVLQFCIKDLPVDFDERHAAVREVYALRDKHLRATCPSLLDGFIKKVHGDDVDTKGMEFLRSVYELAPLVGEGYGSLRTNHGFAPSPLATYLMGDKDSVVASKYFGAAAVNIVTSEATNASARDAARHHGHGEAGAPAAHIVGGELVVAPQPALSEGAQAAAAQVAARTLAEALGFEGPTATEVDAIVGATRRALDELRRDAAGGGGKKPRRR